MPSISDPGAELVSKCHERGVEVEIVPGPTAVASAMALSGIKGNGFTFIGFLPEKNADKVSILSKASLAGLPIVLYVAPHDLVKTAKTILQVLGDRKAYVVRELTKIHESVTITTLARKIRRSRKTHCLPQVQRAGMFGQAYFYHRTGTKRRAYLGRRHAVNKRPRRRTRL